MMERALAEYIVNALWQVPLLAGGAWLLLRIVRPGPQTQHRVWLTVLALALLVPLRGMAPDAVNETSTNMFTQQPALGAVSTPHYARTRTLRMNANAAHWLVRLYLVTVAFAGLRIGRAWFAARDLVADAQDTSRHAAALAHYSQRFRVALPQMRESGAVSSPMIVGVRVPILLVPDNFAGFAEDEVRAALCHELAHIKRRDYLMNLVCQMAALPLAWHPVLAQIQQRIRMTREMVCDAMAAEEMQSHIGYARCLLALAHSILGGRDTMRQEQFLGLFSNNTLEERIMRLMETSTMSLRARILRTTGGAAAMIAAGSLAAMFHVTPTMAELREVAPQSEMQTAAASSQTQPVVPEPQASPSPVQDKPADKGHAARGKRTYVSHDQIDKQVKEQMEQAKRQVAAARIMLDDPEFKQRMEEAERQMAKARLMLAGPEFKQQMEETQRQMAKAKAMLDSQEFKQQMEDATRQAGSASAMLNNPEFKQQMEHLQEQIREEMKDSGFDWRLAQEPPSPAEGTPAR